MARSEKQRERPKDRPNDEPAKPQPIPERFWIFERYPGEWYRTKDFESWVKGGKSVSDSR